MKKKTMKKVAVFGAALMVLTLSACSQKKESAVPAVESESSGSVQVQEKVPSDGKLASDAYREAISNIDTYDFKQDSDTNTVSQQYALVDTTEDGLPEMLILKGTDSGFKYIKVFGFDVYSKTLIETQDVLNIGVAESGGFRGGISASNASYGLLLDQGSSGTGKFTTYRILIAGDRLTQEQVDEYMLDSTSNSEIEAEKTDITWHELTDDAPLKELETMDSTVKKSNTVQEDSATMQEDTSTENEETQIEADGISTFKGTVRILNSADLCALQGVDNPNPDSPDETNVVLVFDSPQDVTATNVDQESRTETATMIWLSRGDKEDFSSWSAYDQKSVIIQIDPNEIYWPSDTSLPLGEPRVIKASVIGE